MISLILNQSPCRRTLLNEFQIICQSIYGPVNVEFLISHTRISELWSRLYNMQIVKIFLLFLEKYMALFCLYDSASGCVTAVQAPLCHMPPFCLCHAAPYVSVTNYFIFVMHSLLFLSSSPFSSRHALLPVCVF